MTIHSESSGRGIHEPGQFQVQNDTGSDISKGKFVKLSGFGTFPQVELVTDPVNDVVWGMTVDTILDGERGFVARAGLFGQFDTSSFSVNDPIYSDASGDPSTTPLGIILGRIAAVDTDDGHYLFDVPSEGELTISGGSGGHTVELRVLTPGEVAAKAITLGAAPALPAETVVMVEGGASQQYGNDFTVSGTTLTFLTAAPDALGNQIASGDNLTILRK